MIQRTLLCLLLASSTYADPYTVYYLSVGISEYAPGGGGRDENPFHSIRGANSSARAVANLLDGLNAAYGITLVSRTGEYVSQVDIYTALDDVLKRVTRASL